MTLFQREPTEHAEHVGGEAGDNTDLHIQTSTIGLGFLEGLTPYVTRVQGTMQADVRVTGSGRDPHVEGFIDLKGGAFSTPVGNASYTGLDTRIELTPDKVLIKGFQILDENGHPLNVAGELATHERQVEAVDMRITSDDFEIMDNQYGDVGVNADLRVTGELRRPRLVGNVEFSEGRFEVDRILDAFAERRPASRQVVLDKRGLPPLFSTEPQAAGRPELVAPSTAPAVVPQPPAPGSGEQTGPETTGLFDALNLDVSLSVPNNVVLRGTDLRGPADAPIGLGGLNITIGGAVNARKAPGERVRLLGQIETVRGTYDFQGRRFDILRDGRIQFQNTDDLDPLIDITATRLITGVEARVHVHGTLKQPELELSSTPPMDQAEVLSLIMFNQPINQLGEGEKISLGARASALATGFVATPLAHEIARALDVDLFEIQMSEEAGAMSPRLTIGQQLGQRLYVKFSQQFGAQDVSELVLEYELAEFLRLQTIFSEGADRTAGSLTQRVERGGADLVFFFSY
jgi:translocation and assembly module TamB